MQSDNNPFNNLKQNEIGLFSYIKISNSEESFKEELENNKYKNMKNLNKITEGEIEEKTEGEIEEKTEGEIEEKTEEEEYSIWIKNHEIIDLVKNPDELNKLNEFLHRNEVNKNLRTNPQIGGDPKVKKNKTKKNKRKQKIKQNK
jgi:hypothetical protein